MRRRRMLEDKNTPSRVRVVLLCCGLTPTLTLIVYWSHITLFNHLVTAIDEEDDNAAAAATSSAPPPQPTTLEGNWLWHGRLGLWLSMYDTEQIVLEDEPQVRMCVSGSNVESVCWVQMY